MTNVKFPAKQFTIDSLYNQLSRRKDGAGITRTGLFLKVKRAEKAGVLVKVGLKEKVKVRGVKPKGRKSVIYAVAPVVAEVAPAEVVTEVEGSAPAVVEVAESQS